MRTLSIPYTTALALARQSRPIISPNSGFASQLKVWEECRYEVYLPGTLEEKPSYKMWRDGRDELLKGGEEAVNRARISAMGSMAAGFGRMRTKKIGDLEEVNEDVDLTGEEEKMKVKRPDEIN
jgi:hypothetical protein